MMEAEETKAPESQKSSDEESSETETDDIEEEDGDITDEEDEGEDMDADGDQEQSEENAEEGEDEKEGAGGSGSESGEDAENRDSHESDSDGCERDKCCICLHKLRNQEIGVPTVCEHRFCCECITEWHKNSQTCPIDRRNFDSISVLRDDGTFLRMEELHAPDDDEYLDLPPLPDDITQCEVCGLGDREDRLLLCDECNFGYHLECLNPPLQTVPLDDWFCPNCTQEFIAHPRRRRVILPPLGPPPEIILPPAEPESIQLSLLTRRIRQRRRKSRRKPVRRRKTATTRKRKTPAKGKSKSKAKSRTTKRKTGVRRRKSRKVRRKTKRRARVAVPDKPITARDRLANQLGILPPKPGQIYLGLPNCKSTSQPSTSSAAMNAHKFKAGISTLRLYSHYEDLADCLENESDDEQFLGDGSVGLIRPALHRSARFPNKMGIDASIGSVNRSTAPDILSQIMSSQQTLLSDRNVRIGRDGVLIPSVTSTGSSTINKTTSPAKSSTQAVLQLPNGSIRQAPLSNSDQPQNLNQNNRYNNDNSTCADRYAESNSKPDNQTAFTTTSNSHESGDNHDFTENVGSVSNDHCSQSPQKSNTTKAKNDEKSKPSKDEDDEDFNIYSDIQENNVADEVDQDTSAPGLHELGFGEIQNESDTEMIIDEESNRRRASSDDKPANQETSSKINASDYVAFPPMSDSDSSPSPGMPEADSPESIPLPDTTPPPSIPMPSGGEDEEVDQIQGGSVLYSPSDDEESGGQVYDPSQPLTSSDEEEHNERQKLPSKRAPVPAQKEIPQKDPQPSSSSRSMNAPKPEVSSIPAPADEHRRPAIQFSIPTRHKLIPISSLIKRQRGVVRKESSGAANNQLDSSRLFGENSQTDATDGVSDSNTDRPSLVSEIFGSDEEEEESKEETPVEQDVNVTQESTVVSDAAEQNTLETASTFEFGDNAQSNKWKRVEDTPAPFDIQNTLNIDALRSNELRQTDESANASVGDFVRENEAQNENRTNQSSSSVMSKKPISLDVVSDGSDDEIVIISSTKREDPNPDIIFLSSEKSSTSKDSSGRDGSRERRKGSDRRSRKGKDERHSRSQNRRGSSSLSNFEEGEIPSLDKKKKKLKKSKKLKKRKRSKDSHSSPRTSVGDRQPDADQNVNSSSDADDSRKVSWRKPSKSTKERNYRDGKPKTEEKHFREKDKADGDRKDKGRDKSPRNRSRDRRGSKSEVKKPHRRSTSRDKVSPIRWSRSPSRSRNRVRSRHERGRTRSASSRDSFSPRRSTHSRNRHLGHSLSIRNERSRSKSPRMRSRTPNSDKYKHHRRSHSRNRNRGRRAGSSSGSRSRSRSKARRRHDKPEAGEKAKKTSSKKDKEKTSDAGLAEEEMKEREKKKKRRRKEKSISPAKAVFTDGDSIVISLNFQKPKESTKDMADESEPPNTGEPAEKKRKRSSGRDTTTSSKSKPLKKTVLIDLETSPVQEQKIGESPPMVVLTDEEEETSADDNTKSSRKGKDSHHNEKDHDDVTTSGGGEDSSSPNFQHGKGVQADSTQIHQTETSKSKDSFSQDESTNSPARGDSVVTSTRDSIEENPQTEEDMDIGSPLNSPDPPPESQSAKNDSPIITPPIVESPMNRQFDGLRNDSLRSTPTSSAASGMGLSNTNPAMTFSTTSNSSGQGGLVRPLGIGNIPGLFPSSSLTSGIPLPPPAVVIPTPPQPTQFAQRFPSNAMNPSINILASVANALYGPLMAASQRQGQSMLSKPISTVNNIGQRPTSQNQSQNSNILLPKNQNSHSHGRGGDSPFSPNSSDGDDLFEPPLEKRMNQSAKDSQSGLSGNSLGPKSDKSDRQTVPNPPIIGAASAITMKSKNALFDSLFGSPSTKTPTPTTSSHLLKPHIKIKAKPQDPSKPKVPPKPDAPKQLTEGELRQTEDVPTSAVELRVKEKYLKKLNRQERVVEEVKLALKPHYGKKSINKDDYKEILRRAVPKICHTKSGEINPFKIKELIEAYVKKFRHSTKKEK